MAMMAQSKWIEDAWLDRAERTWFLAELLWPEDCFAPGVTVRTAGRLMEGRSGSGDGSRVRRAPPLRRCDVEIRDVPALPALSAGTHAQLEQVARIRKLPHCDGPALAAHHGTLRFCTAYDEPAWAVLDVENACNVQLRKMDGTLWFGKTKVMGITGNWAAWPVGLSVALKMPGCEIWLVEGSGDFIAAWHCVAEGWGNFVPVAMFGASQAIHAGALPLFAGRCVTIIQQHDERGAEAAARWERQLSETGACVRVCVVPGDGNDLNDWVSAGGGGGWVNEENRK